MQPLLDDPDVENIDINGCDQIFVGYSDGREERPAPIADTDDELVELVQVLAAYSGLSSRPFDSANPQLDIRLPDGSRHVRGDGRVLTAVDQHPSGPARRGCSSRTWSRTRRWTRTSPAFLSALVAARKNIMIAGATNAGKTTLLRALANEIPAHERLITVERALELGLGEYSDIHPNVVSFEERLPNSEGQGAHQHGRAGPPFAADEPQPGDRR